MPGLLSVAGTRALRAHGRVPSCGSQLFLNIVAVEMAARLPWPWEPRFRRRRLALGLSQQHLGDPFTRSFVSLVETGRLTPSLPSLRIIASTLGTSAAGILASVEAQLED